MKILLVVVGAALGATLRFILGGLVADTVQGAFPWGTLLINLTGCLVMGILWGLAERSGWSSAARAFVFVGILGSYTTFSSFGIETVRLWQDGLAGQAVLYVVASNLLGLLLVWAGVGATRIFLV